MSEKQLRDIREDQTQEVADEKAKEALMGAVFFNY